MVDDDEWKLVTAMVAVFAFSLEIRPLDSYLTAYLTGPSVNASLKVVSDVLTPFRIFCAMFGCFLVFILSDYLRYKPVMIFNGLTGMLAYICLISSPKIFILKLAELGLALFTCAELSYCGYLYAKIRDKEHYQVATGYVKAGMLSGTCLSGILGQLTVYWTSGDYSTLPYFSLAGVTFATIWACFLPPVKHSTYFHPDDGETDVFSKTIIHNPNTRKYTTEKNEPQNNAEQADTHPAVPRAHTSMVKTQLFKRFYGDFKHSYRNPMVRRWSYWHTVGLIGYIQIFLYINVLYTYITDMSDDKDILLNGLVDSLANFCAAFSAYNIGKLDVDWTRHGDTLLTISSLAIGLPLLMCFYLKNIIFVYPMYIIYMTLVQSIFVIVISQIAKQLKDNCFTLVLGFNAFLAMILSTVMSMLLVQIGISVPGHFLIYSCVYILLGVFYGFTALFNNKTTYESPA